MSTSPATVSLVTLVTVEERAYSHLFCLLTVRPCRQWWVVAMVVPELIKSLHPDSNDTVISGNGIQRLSDTVRVVIGEQIII